MAHRHGVIHRDLKPGNIMLTKMGAKLLDFGLAKVRAAEPAIGMSVMHTQGTSLTAEGTMLGTLHYMAPEQLEGGEADARADVFALGAVIYEMATGRKAFEGKSQASVISAIMSSEPPILSSVQAMAPLALDHVVRTCLAKDPDARWQTAHDVLIELKWIAEGGTATQVGMPAALARSRKRARQGWIVAACLAVALVVSMVIAYLRPTPQAALVKFQVTPPHNTGVVEELWSPVISPDGQYLAFNNSVNGRWRISLHSLKSLVANPLPGTERTYPFGFSWSPDSREIAFSTGSALKKISITGGPPQTICELTGDDIAWNRDNVILIGGNRNQPLFRVAATGGEPTALTKLDQSRREIGHSFVHFLPDGQHFLYLASSTKPENSATYLGSLDSSEVKRIHAGNGNAVYAPPGYLLFLRGTTLMAQRLNLRKAELSGNPILITDPVFSFTAHVGLPRTIGSFSVSENGVLTYLPASGVKHTQLIWFDRGGNRLGTLGEPADYSTRSGHRDIYTKPASGVGEEQVLMPSDESKTVEDWSEDGQYLVYDVEINKWLFSFRTQKSLPLLHGNFRQDQFRFSPNRHNPPRWIAYCSYEAGTGQVYVRSLAGALAGSGGKWQISTNGGTEAQWRGDGKELFYFEDKKLMAVEVDANGESFQPGIPKELFETRVTPEVRRNRYIVGSDGKRFLINVLVQQPEGESFNVILNWPALLKR
jgi:serine/threonine protein kinase